ncbi:MAG: rhomboid family intramembrane serine protease [Promethearchaeota archaeon]
MQDCVELLDYLPFKCRYCGGTFCKKHRLPENHQCSFTFKQDGKFQSSSSYNTTQSDVKMKKTAPDIYSGEYESNEDYERKLEREMKNYIRNQERSSMPPPPNNDSSRIRSFSRSIFASSGKFPATYWLIGLNIGFFIIGSVMIAFGGELGIFFLNFTMLFRNFRLWTMFTAMFVNMGNFASFFGILSLGFSMFILYFVGRMLEQQFGSKTLVNIYLWAGIMGAAGALIFQVFMSLLPLPVSIGFINAYFSVQSAAMSGLYGFLIFLMGLNREMRIYLYFIPVKMKGKYILYFLLGLNSLFIILGIFGVTGAATALSSFAQIIGMGVGYYFYKKHGRAHAISRFI